MTISLADAGSDESEIYLTGKIASDEVKLDSTDRAPAHLFACSNCHGVNARGKKEGGISAPDISWPRLSMSYRIANNIGGEKRPIYNRALFKRAVVDGIDSAGKRLSQAMPRYTLTDLEVDALLFYLQQLDQTRSIGVDDHYLTIGVLLPSNSAKAIIVKQILLLYINNIEQSGGIFQRNIRPVFIEQLNGVNWESDNCCFAFLIINPDQPSNIQYHNLVKDKLVISLFTNKGMTEQAALFNLYVGNDYSNQDSVLRVFAKQQEYVLDADLGQATARLIDRDELVNYISQLRAKQLQPVLLIKGKINAADEQLLRSYQSAAYTVLPPTLHLVSKQGVREYNQLVTGPAVQYSQLTLQVWTLTVAKLLVYALRQAGQTIYKDKIIDNLEKLYQHETDLGPPISFVANQRVGNSGGMIVLLDTKAKLEKFQPLWINVRKID